MSDSVADLGLRSIVCVPLYVSGKVVGAGVTGQGTATRAAQELSDAILKPLGERLAGRQRLVILADGALHLVPFAALPGSTGEPLLADPEIVMVPSATVLQAQRRRFAGRQPAPGLAALLADPIFSPTDQRIASSLSRSAGEGGRGCPLPCRSAHATAGT